MAYDLYPAVDGTYNFPPEVRAALAASAELRNTVVPMTETQRNNLTGAALWNGRTIVNTTSGRINRYNLGTTSWVAIADVSDSTPIGAIIAYGGTVAPSGWHLCNGSVHNSPALQAITGSPNAPDLRDRFIVGVGSTYAQNDTGGSATVTLTASQSGVNAHTHPASSGTESATHTHPVDPPITTSSADTHSHQVNVQEGALDLGSPTYDGTFIDTVEATQAGLVAVGSTDEDTHTHTTNIAQFNSAEESGTHSHTVTVANNATAAASSAHENRPPYYALTYIIKTT